MTVDDTFPLTKCIVISTTTDAVFEANHTFSVYIIDMDPEGILTIGEPLEHTVTIIDAGKCVGMVLKHSYFLFVFSTYRCNYFIHKSYLFWK